MNSEVIVGTGWSDEERSAILEEMNQILADPAFKSSKRCQSLLRSLVEHALAGDHDLKERTLGIKVFGRDPSYDTATDPVVRTTANEIRKRLAQSYQQPNRRHAVRINLIPGSYLPKFDFSSPIATQEAHPVISLVNNSQPAISPTPEFVEPSPAPETPGDPSPWKKWAFGLAALAILSIIAILVHSNSLISAEAKIWEPLTQQEEPLTLLISDEDWQADAQEQSVDPLALIGKVIASRDVPQHPNSSVLTAKVPVVDAFIANKLTDRIAVHGKQTVLHRSSEMSFDDLRHQSVVIIEGTNPWSLILLSKLRYSVRVDPATHTRWIQDSGNPSSRNWAVSDERERTDVDYAIVSRFRDPETGRWIISLGGLFSYGTVSACSLLTDSEYAYMLPRALYGSQNTQIVLKTTVINGNPGPPQVLATYAW